MQTTTDGDDRPPAPMATDVGDTRLGTLLCDNLSESRRISRRDIEPDGQKFVPTERGLNTTQRYSPTRKTDCGWQRGGCMYNSDVVIHIFSIPRLPPLRFAARQRLPTLTNLIFHLNPPTASDCTLSSNNATSQRFGFSALPRSTGF